MTFPAQQTTPVPSTSSPAQAAGISLPSSGADESVASEDMQPLAIILPPTQTQKSKAPLPVEESESSSSDEAEVTFDTVKAIFAKIHSDAGETAAPPPSTMPPNPELEDLILSLKDSLDVSFDQLLATPDLLHKCVNLTTKILDKRITVQQTAQFSGLRHFLAKVHEQGSPMLATIADYEESVAVQRSLEDVLAANAKKSQDLTSDIKAKEVAFKDKTMELERLQEQIKRLQEQAELCQQTREELRQDITAAKAAKKVIVAESKQSLPQCQSVVDKLLAANASYRASIALKDQLNKEWTRTKEDLLN